MSDKESEESWINHEDRGMSRESHEQYMYRRNQEENLIKGTHEYELSLIHISEPTRPY